MNSSSSLFTELKLTIYDRWNEHAAKSLKPNEWFHVFQEILHSFFDVSICQFYLFDKGGFTPLKTNNILHTELLVCTWEELKQTNSNLPNVSLESFQPIHNEKLSGFIFQNEENTPQALMVVEPSKKWEEFTKTSEISSFSHMVAGLIENVKKQTVILNQEKQYRQLFNMNEIFHSTLEIGQILEGILTAMKTSFPKFESTLILSNDTHINEMQHVRILDYQTEREKTVEAYVSGEMTLDCMEDGLSYMANVPLKGRQGIYGILHIQIPGTMKVSNRQKEFIRMLANSTGSALENAQLYHSSFRVINELQLINETSQKLNHFQALKDMVKFIEIQIIKAVKPDHVAFMFWENLRESQLVRGNVQSICDMEPFFENFLCKRFSQHKEPLFIADVKKITDQSLTYQSFMIVPIYNNQQLEGCCAVFHHNPYYFSFDSFKLMQSLIHQGSLAISNSILRDQLQEMVDLDHLTKLFARNYLDQFVENSLIEHTRGIFILIDIDNFKKVNDTYGHQIGDRILVQISDFMKQLVKKTGISARWGGEELAIYIPDVELREGLEIAQILVQNIPDITNPSVTISVGVSHWDSKEIPYHELFHAADAALYKAKNSGKNQIRVHGSEEMYI